MVAWLATIAAAVAMTKAGQYMASEMIKRYQYEHQITKSNSA
jgi:hypothetical protein